MRWDDVDQRYVAVEVVEEVRIGIQAVSIGNEDLSSKSVEVQQAILERRQALQDAQEEKRARLRAQRSAAESEADAQIALKARLDPQLKRWCEDHGKKKNIRALLAGMDQVMCRVGIKFRAPRHRRDAVSVAAPARWRRASTPSSRRRTRNCVGSMA